MQYPIVIHKDEGSTYGVTVPDLPGCFSGGETLEDAVSSAQEAIVGHIATLLLDGQPIPERASLDTHQANEDYADGIWALVEFDASKLHGKAARLNITIPAHILTIIDNAAARVGESRSAFLTRGALYLANHEMESLKLP
jgi:predicted RNase H-like HicB family nuclease